jgi:hypothetical protein
MVIMVIRFPFRDKKEIRLESHPSGLNRLGPRRLSRREVEHRERMLQHLSRLRRTPNPEPFRTLEPLEP